MPSSVRPNVLRMAPYPPGRPIEDVQRELGLTDIIKLASNENPLGPSPLAVDAVVRSASSLNIYPDARGYTLRAKLAERHGLSPDHVILGCGSDEIVGILGTMFLDSNSEVLTAEPSFMRYRAAADIADAAHVKVSLGPRFEHDVDALIASVTERTRLVYLANPNNPTGTSLNSASLVRFLDALPPGLTVVLDEAYFEYAVSFLGSEVHPDGSKLVREGRPVVALRTFSKAYGLAGIRVGYGFADPELTRTFDAARPPFDVNSLAQTAAVAALDDTDHLERTLQANKKGMDQVVSYCAKLGLETVPSIANFVCIEVGDSAAVCDRLLRKGVIVRPGVQLGMPHHIRVSIGTESENGRFLDALAQSLPVGERQ